MPRKPELGILRLKEKHGEQYFDCSTEEKLYAVCLMIVKARHKEGYWYNFDKPTEPENLEAPENLDKMPEYIKKVYASKVKEKEEEWRKYNRKVAEYNEFQRALKSGEDAYIFLSMRNDYEYEGFEIVNLQDKYYC